ncbi:superoxide dismutase family protein [Fodinibius sediminis]|uniref:Superoxide dismutase, Cu-Zn family n=1 Tax=Fodinibius sediminis TaxID=1214077 RepID=A0A521D4F7_9BACT|nr:superoxide dismutase family protein [Fodinibius sediminis]SMO66568.1 superoxide dismutase, Cu-Zn family [Fodinibius sediminis]
MTLFKNISVVLSMMLFAMGCAQQESQEENMQSGPQVEQEVEETMSNAPEFSKTVAVIHPTEGNEASGTVTFTKTADGVQVQAEVTGLAEGKHGFHIHQYGDCTAADGTSAGGHFNPASNDHAGPTAESRHMGDMGNIEADADGNATIDYVDSTIDINQIIGRGIIIHGGEDDLESQPTGAAGPRMGCGVIGIASN